MNAASRAQSIVQNVQTTIHVKSFVLLKLCIGTIQRNLRQAIHPNNTNFLYFQVVIETLHSVTTEVSADSVEWCPYAPHQQYFVCGTYKLDDSDSAELQVPARRYGSIYLYSYDSGNDVLDCIDHQDTAAILDLKWSQSNGYGNGDPLLASANALGEVLLHRMTDSKLQPLSSVHLNGENDNMLTLAIDWNSDKCADRKIVASDSKGGATLLQLTESSLNVVSTWEAHLFETWTCCFDKRNDHLLYTGGDDMLLNVFDTRLDDPKVMSTNIHQAGVTTCLSFVDSEHMLATGSYDERLRLLDKRNLKVSLAEVNLGGGIWRIKQNPAQPDLLLCACMYHNFSIVRMSEPRDRMEMVAAYFEHGSICYGADWCYKSGKEQESFMATCSFYDRKLCISKVSQGIVE